MNFVMEDIFGYFYKDIDLVKERNQNPLPVLPRGEALDAYTAFLHEEMRQCFLQGHDHAAIVMACAVLEFTFRSAIYFEENPPKTARKFDQSKWDEIEKKNFSTLIGWAKRIGLISKAGHKMLDKFCGAVRNKYMHGSTPRQVKETTITVFEGNLQTGEAKEREIELSTDLALQRVFRLIHDRKQCDQVVLFVDRVVRDSLDRMNAKLAEWKKNHPSPKTSVDQFHSIMDKAREHGFEGGMAITRDVPDGIGDTDAHAD